MTLSKAELDVLSKLRFPRHKSKPSIYVFKDELDVLNELVDYDTYISLSSKKAENKLKRWGRIITEDYMNKMVYKKRHKLECRTYGYLKERYLAAFGQRVKPFNEAY